MVEQRWGFVTLERELVCSGDSPLCAVGRVAEHGGHNAGASRGRLGPQGVDEPLRLGAHGQQHGALPQHTQQVAHVLA